MEGRKKEEGKERGRERDRDPSKLYIPIILSQDPPHTHNLTSSSTTLFSIVSVPKKFSSCFLDLTPGCKTIVTAMTSCTLMMRIIHNMEN